MYNQPRKASSNAFANGQNQNCGNGIVDGHPTTRVLQQPGGAQSYNILTGEGAPAGPRTPAHPHTTATHNA